VLAEELWVSLMAAAILLDTANALKSKDLERSFMVYNNWYRGNNFTSCNVSFYITHASRLVRLNGKYSDVSIIGVAYR
jgi:hypothetical protein